MIYTTGSKDDWDHIGRITGDPAWTWDAMARYRDLNQKYVPPNDNHNDVSQKQVLLLILIALHRWINTSRRHTVITGWCPLVFLGTRGRLIQEFLQPPMNQPSRPSFPSNET